MSGCDGKCVAYAAKAVKLVGFAGTAGRYAAGQKYCVSCEQFMEYDGRYCPCCSRMLRTTPKNGRERHNETKRNGIIGLCHGCYSSNQRLAISDGRALCEKCQK